MINVQNFVLVESFGCSERYDKYEKKLKVGTNLLGLLESRIIIIEIHKILLNDLGKLSTLIASDIKRT